MSLENDKIIDNKAFLSVFRPPMCIYSPVYLIFACDKTTQTKGSSFGTSLGDLA